jgi:acyl-CoA reductase-like NAD-dependent aldehyde dehydrogenase
MEERAAVLRQWAQGIDAAAEELTAAMVLDTGRYPMAAGEVASAAANIRRWCDRGPGLVAYERQKSSLMDSLEIDRQLVPYQLLGVISPWNFPLILSLIDAVPALLAGCAVYIKPSEITPRFVEPLRRTIKNIPALDGVLEIAPGDGVTGAALIEEVDVVCFTGSVATGRKVAVAAAQCFIPAFLELGGKDPAVILPGADLVAAADAVLRGAVVATGQACLSQERVYVHESDFDEFVRILVEKSERVALNYPDIMQGHIGPLIFGHQADIIDAQLEDAVARGAEIQCGGKSETLGGGRYCRATVVTGVNHDMQLMTEETFGPVMPVMAYSTVDEAVELANDTKFGLSGAVIGPTTEEAEAVARRINAGGMSVNDCALTRDTYEAEKNAFGLSGMGGSRMGDEGLLRFFRKKALLVQKGRPASMV